jgi:S-adenosylmethionine uptake transporter
MMMPILSINERGILLTIAAMGSFVCHDTLIKLATENLPPFEIVVLRSVFAMVWAIPLLALTGGFRQLGKVLEPRVLARNGFDLLASLGLILGIAHVPIAEFSALCQLEPILLMLVAAIFLGLKVTRAQFSFAAIAFVGALLVVQPGGAAFSLYYLFGIWFAAMGAGRDLVGRAVPKGISGAVVAFGAALLALVAGAAGMLVFESFVMPDPQQLALIVFAALFLIGGHVFIFLAYRKADPGAVAPFVYVGMLWATLASVFVFGVLPNGLAFAGMALIVVSGVGVLVLSGNGRRKRITDA